jgi:hypothetical protein
VQKVVVPTHRALRPLTAPSLHSAGTDGVPVGQLPELVKSLGGDYKWMKEAEIEEMAGIRPGELAHVRGILTEPEQAVSELELAVAVFRAAAAVGHAEHAAASAAAKAAEAPAGEPEKKELLLTSQRQAEAAAEAARAAAAALGGGRATIDFPTFVTLRASLDEGLLQFSLPHFILYGKSLHEKQMAVTNDSAPSSIQHRRTRWGTTRRSCWPTRPSCSTRTRTTRG